MIAFSVFLVASDTEYFIQQEQGLSALFVSSYLILSTNILTIGVLPQVLVIALALQITFKPYKQRMVGGQ